MSTVDTMQAITDKLDSHHLNDTATTDNGNPAGAPDDSDVARSSLSQPPPKLDSQPPITSNGLTGTSTSSTNTNRSGSESMSSPQPAHRPPPPAPVPSAPVIPTSPVDTSPVVSPTSPISPPQAVPPPLYPRASAPPGSTLTRKPPPPPASTQAAAAGALKAGVRGAPLGSGGGAMKIPPSLAAKMAA